MKLGMSSKLRSIWKLQWLPSAGLILAGLAVSLPFLIPYHNYPLLTFYEEWAAVLIGLLAACFVLLRLRNFPPLLPWISLALLGICVVLWVQILLGLIAYPQRSMIGVMYALWAAIIAWTGIALRERCGIEKTCTVLAGFIAAGAWLMSITGYMQYFEISTVFGRFVEGVKQVGMYGVLAQRNLFANYVACGLASVGFLLARGRLRLIASLLLGIPMAAALAYAGSRSAWAYVVVLMIVCIWLANRAKLKRESSGMHIGM